MTRDEGLEDSLGQPYVDRWAYTDDLLLAIGRVATESAMLDAALMEIVNLLSLTETWWRITEGQNTDWLLNTCKILLEEINPYYKRYSKNDHDLFMSLLREGHTLRVTRNLVVHGLWTTEHFLDENLHPLPWTEIDLKAIYTVGLGKRGREGSNYVEKYMSIDDVNQLAREIARLRDELVRAHRRMSGVENAQHWTMPRWGRDEDDGRDRWGKKK